MTWFRRKQYRLPCRHNDEGWQAAEQVDSAGRELYGL